MSLGPVNSNSQLQQTRAAELAPKKEAAKVGEQATATPAEADAKAPVLQEIQDAARAIQDAAGKAIQKLLNPLPGGENGEFLEAKGRKRGGRGGKTMAQGPTRGLTPGGDVA